MEAYLVLDALILIAACVGLHRTQGAVSQNGEPLRLKPIPVRRNNRR